VRVFRAGAVVIVAVFMAGCASEAQREPGFIIWLPGQSEQVRVVPRGPVEAAYGPRALVQLAGPAAAAHPVRVRVPAIGADAPLIELGLDRGRLAVPRTPSQAGWYGQAPRPGELGPAVIAGHVQLGRHPGVFAALQDLGPGEFVHVDYDDGTSFVFFTYAREEFAKAAFPTMRVYGDTPGAELRLITCGGTIDRATRHYRDNVVIYADLVARI
jgi:sortase (surface protein transpeptidase)